MGPGKRYPGLSLFNNDGNEIPVFFAATKNASMTSTILRDTFREMDGKGITQRGVDEKGKQFYPCVVIDGHISRMGEDYLRYVNDPDHLWMPRLGAPYGTSIWQYHDDTRMNGTFKMKLHAAKSWWIMKKRKHGLPAEILPEEVVVVVR